MSLTTDRPDREERQEKLDQDFQTPYRPADDSDDTSQLDDTHPATDSGLQEEELYGEGAHEAFGITEPNHGNAVTGMTEDMPEPLPHRGLPRIADADQS